MYKGKVNDFSLGAKLMDTFNAKMSHVRFYLTLEKMITVLVYSPC